MTSRPPPGEGSARPRRRVNDEMSSSATTTLRSQLGRVAHDLLRILSVEFAHRAHSSGHALALAA
jgi:hypothetical protein